MSEALTANWRAPSRDRSEETGGRWPEAAVDPIFLRRRSTRVFAPEPVPPAVVRSLFEAARWSPSSYNRQPWLFVAATKPAERERLLEGLVEPNRRWAREAPVLVFLFARRLAENGEPNAYAEFDAGAAWMALALQANLHGLSAHAMGGILPERMSAIAGLDPAEYRPMAAIAVGYPAPPGQVPAELADSERPSGRRPLGEVFRTVVI